jgi:hypothetical protein
MYPFLWIGEGIDLPTCGEYPVAFGWDAAFAYRNTPYKDWIIAKKLIYDVLLDILQAFITLYPRSLDTTIIQRYADSQALAGKLLQPFPKSYPFRCFLLNS